MAYDYYTDKEYVSIDEFCEHIQMMEKRISDLEEEVKDGEHDMEFYKDIIHRMMELLRPYKHDDDMIEFFLELNKWTLADIVKERNTNERPI